MPASRSTEPQRNGAISGTSNQEDDSSITATGPLVLPVQVRFGRLVARDISDWFALLGESAGWLVSSGLSSASVPTSSHHVFGHKTARTLATQLHSPSIDAKYQPPSTAAMPSGNEVTRLIRQTVGMRLQRHVVVLDAADIESVSTFWTRLLDGRMFADDTFHCVLDGDGRWVLGVQLAPDHTPPDWPHGNAQQIHLDLHVEDPHAAHAEAIATGARLLQDADLAASEGFQVYADPAGHPFCIGWGHPSDETIKKQFEALPNPALLQS